MSDYLLKGTVEVTTNNKCQTRYSKDKNKYEIIGSQICGNVFQGQDACTGGFFFLNNNFYLKIYYLF